MKKKISIGIIIIAVIVAVYFLFAPSPVDEQRTREKSEVKQTLELTAPGQTGEADTAQGAGGDQDADRVARMRAEYDVLVEERRKLQNQINEVRARLFDVKLPAQEAEKLNKEMMRAYVLLRNPPMLGAFRDVNGIDDELAKVRAAQEDVTEVGKRVEEVKDQ